MVKNLLANAGDAGSIPGPGRSPGEGNGNPLQYSGLGNPMERGAWWAAVRGPHHKVTWGNLLIFPSFESTLPDEPNRPETWKRSCFRINGGVAGFRQVGQQNYVHCTTHDCLCLTRLEYLKGSFLIQDHFKGGPFLGIPLPLSFLYRIQKKGYFGRDLLEGWLLKMVFAKLPSACALSPTPPMTFLQVPSLPKKLCSTSTEEKNPIGCHTQIESESC